jgi:23S rRNA (cytosine1962-C5)-methyltransferase
LYGSLPGAPWSLRELHWRMEVDVLEGQKTGWFLDQRENRRRVFELARGRRVANLFSYTGGFSLAAALGGAAAVASIDISAPATAAARRNFELNGLDPDDYLFAAVDAFDWLAAEVAAGHNWDLIIVDPPSFAPNARSVPAALKAYRRLLQGAASLVADDGLVAAASCSSHIDFPDLEGVFAAGVAAAGRNLQILERRGPGVDHPELTAFPEGRYLKFVLGRVDNPRGVAADADNR